MSDKTPDFNDVRRLLAHKLIAVTTSQSELKSEGSAAAGREEIVVYNDSTNTVYIGLTGVTASGANKGWPVGKQSFASFPSPENNALFAISASGSNNIIVFEFGD